MIGITIDNYGCHGNCHYIRYSVMVQRLTESETTGLY